MEYKIALRGLIEIYENDFCCGYDGDDKPELELVFLKLIVRVTRLTNDYRYCSRPECSCSPESSLKNFYNYNKDTINNRILNGHIGLSDVPLFKLREFLEKFSANN